MKLPFSPVRAIRFLLVPFAILVSVATANADLKVVESMTMDMSKMQINGQPLTDQMKDSLSKMPMFGGGQGMTMYMKGTKARVEMGQIVTISDWDAKTIMNLNPVNKTYTVQPIPDMQHDPVMSSMTIDVKDLGTTEQLLGYTCHGYEMTMSGKKFPMVMDMMMWVAPDIAIPEMAHTGNMQLDALIAKFKGSMRGFPLKSVGNMTSNVFGSATVSTTVTSISTDSLSDSVFEPPADYTKVNAPKMPAGFPGAPPQ